MILDTLGTKLADTLSQNPMLGVGTSIVVFVSSSQELIKSLGILAALGISLVTLAIKLIDLYKKVKGKKKRKKLHIGPDV